VDESQVWFAYSVIVFLHLLAHARSRGSKILPHAMNDISKKVLQKLLGPMDYATPLIRFS
jgi:hypothetical protein